MSSFKPIYRSNNYRAFYEIEAPNAENETVASDGLAINIRLSLTAYDPDVPNSGVAIDTSLNKTATNLPGVGYEAVFLGEDIDAFIADTVTHVYVVIALGVGTILASNRVEVRGKRRAE
jgi:hypothetical protein